MFILSLKPKLFFTKESSIFLEQKKEKNHEEYYSRLIHYDLKYLPISPVREVNHHVTSKSFSNEGEPLFFTSAIKKGKKINMSDLMETPNNRIIKRPCYLCGNLPSQATEKPYNFSTLRYEKFIFGSGDASAKNVK